jgi:hypothetical protein
MLSETSIRMIYRVDSTNIQLLGIDNNYPLSNPGVDEGMSVWIQTLSQLIDITTLRTNYIYIPEDGSVLFFGDSNNSA